MTDATHPDSDAGSVLETDALFAQVYDRLKAMAANRLAGRERVQSMHDANKNAEALLTLFARYSDRN